MKTTSFSALSTQRNNSLLRRSVTMLTMILALALSTEGARGQSEYNFQVQSLPDGTSFGHPANSDPVPVLSMDCLAANGFGQWTLSSTPGQGTGGSTSFPAHSWYLLENALRKPALAFNSSNMPEFPGCVPPGVVQNGTLSVSTSPTEPEATANLDSWIYFLWPDATASRNSFAVNYFQPSDFDLTADFCSSPTIGAMNVVGGITPATIRTATVLTGSHPVISIATGTNTDYRDEYDRASDAFYCYVVWEDASGVIWATAQALGSSTTVMGFPVMVGTGTKPTVACDVRNNRTGTMTPTFDVAFINAANAPVDISFSGSTFTPLGISLSFTPPCGSGGGEAISTVTHLRAMVSSIAGSSSPAHGLYIYGFPNGAGNSGSSALEALFLYTNLSVTPSSPTYCDGPLLTESSPFLTGVNNGIFDEPITAICDPYDNQNNTSTAWDCFHCVYRINAFDHSTTSAVVPLMIMKSNHHGICTGGGTGDTRKVLNAPPPSGGELPLLPGPKMGYVAAVNQMGIHVHWRDKSTGAIHYYARDFNRTFDEPIEENTLVTDVCLVTDGSSSGTNHSGTVGAQLQPGKKMLIWTDPNYGASTSNTNSGLYQPADPSAWWTGILLPNPPVGTLQLMGAPISGGLQTAVTLTIGDGVTNDPPAMLSVMPNFYFFFPQFSQKYGQSLVIDAGSTFNFYGAWERNSAGGNPSASPLFGASQITSSPGVRDGEGLVDLEGNSVGPNYANLVVHGGANFQIGEDVYFTSNYGNITIKNEPNIFPLCSSGTNSNASGVMTFEGQATLDHSIVNSYMGSFDGHRYHSMVIHVCGSYEGDPSANGDEGFGTPGTLHPYARDHAFSSSNTTYSNLNPSNNVSGLGVIIFDQLPLNDGQDVLRGIQNTFNGTYYPIPYMDVSSLDDVFNNVEITALNLVNDDPTPSTNFSISGSTFKGTPVKSIDIEKDNTYLPDGTHYWWGNILISGNTFDNDYYNDNESDVFSGYNIYALNLGASQNTADSLFKLMVETNTFATMHGNGPEYCIFFDQSDGIIGSGNIIGSDATFTSNADAFGYGITINGYHASSWYDLTFVGCDNVIRGNYNTHTYSEVGLVTSNWQGYSKLNTIIGTEYGWWNKSGSITTPPHLIGSIIRDCDGYGIQADATVDLSGVHHGSGGNPELPGAGDVAGYNQIYGSVGAQIVTTNSAANVWVYQDDNGSSWTHAGLNNIYQPNSYWSNELITGAYSGAPANTSVDIGNNFWMVGTTAYDPQTDPTSPHWDYFNYSASVPDVSQQSSAPEMTCSEGEIAKHAAQNPQAIQSNSDSCKNALNSAIFAERNFERLDPAFDTMEWYIRHCYREAQATYAWNGLEGAWGDTVQYPGMRDSVFNFVLFGLGLRNDDEWFCLGVPLLQVKYVQSNGIIDYRACRTIDRFLMDNPRCAWNYDADSSEYGHLLETQWNVWSDSARGYGGFDSTIPTLHDIGLDTLLKFAASAGVHYDIQTSQILLDVRLADNPVTTRTSAIVDVGREAYIHFDVYDILGHKLDGPGYEGVFESGRRSVPLDLSGLASGSYYLRISTANNEVRTIKLVKE